ncbi:hypothetical protein H4219_002867 [Mycoemilia scoparia]|uniref:Uncharacterized protein n=1 Tax=Mycoemilia scoparia TaxID=417184 RepID=A0A9W8A5U4_9FUNG|nr:hypothetical protein H4219_002867 [Mycoemilia scoparia]
MSSSSEYGFGQIKAQQMNADKQKVIDLLESLVCDVLPTMKKKQITISELFEISATQHPEANSISVLQFTCLGVKVREDDNPSVIRDKNVVMKHLVNGLARYCEKFRGEDFNTCVSDFKNELPGYSF